MQDKQRLIKADLSVDFCSRRMPPSTLGHVTLEDGSRLHVFEAELAQEQLWQPGVLVRVGRRVPGGDLVLAKLDGQRRASA